MSDPIKHNLAKILDSENIDLNSIINIESSIEISFLSLIEFIDDNYSSQNQSLLNEIESIKNTNSSIVPFLKLLAHGMVQITENRNMEREL